MMQNTFNAEPLDLMQYINRRFHEPVMHARIALDGRLDTDRLANAITKLKRVFPLIACTYDATSNQFVEREGWQAADVMHTSQDGDRLLFRRMDSSRELISLTLCGDTFYVTISHLTCDGAGFRQLLYLLCDLYNGTMPDVPPLHRDFDQLVAGLSKYERAVMTARMLASMLGGYKNRPVIEASDKQSDFLVERTIDAETMRRIHDKAKRLGATLNDVFLAAYSRALYAISGQSQWSIPCTSDLRKYATAPVGIGNLTGSYNCNIAIREGEPFEETLAKVSKTMSQLKQTRNDLAGPALLVRKYRRSSLPKFLKLYGNMPTQSFTEYTNTGKIDADRLRFDGCETRNFTLFSCNSYAPNLQLCVSSFRGETTFSSLCVASEKAIGKVNGLYDSMLSCLNG